MFVTVAYAIGDGEIAVIGFECQPILSQDQLFGGNGEYKGNEYRPLAGHRDRVEFDSSWPGVCVVRDSVGTESIRPTTHLTT